MAEERYSYTSKSDQSMLAVSKKKVVEPEQNPKNSLAGTLQKELAQFLG